MLHVGKCKGSLQLSGTYTDLEGSGGRCRRLDGLAVDDGQQRGVHGLPQGGVEAVVRAPLRRVADGVPRTAPDNLVSEKDYTGVSTCHRTCNGTMQSVYAAGGMPPWLLLMAAVISDTQGILLQTCGAPATANRMQETHEVMIYSANKR